MISTSRFLRPRRVVSERRPTRSRPALESLEARSLLSVTVATKFTAMGYTTAEPYEPPDTIAAAGQYNVVELVNTDLQVYTKSGATAVSRTSLASLFKNDPNANVGLSFSDPQVLYNVLPNGSGQFFIGVLAYNISSQVSHFDYITLNDDSTLGSTAPNYSAPNYLNVEEATTGTGATGTTGVPLLADFPRVGMNDSSTAPAYYVSFNMFEFTGSQSFDHVQVAIIDKNTLSHTNTWNAPSGQDFTMVPAVMHDNTATNHQDTTEWFVEERGFDNGRQLEVWQMINGLTSPVTGLAWVTVPSYGLPPKAPQPGGYSAPRIDTGDTRMLTAAVLGNHLVATQNVGTGGVAHARWYDINLDRWDVGGNNLDYLYQSGDINPGTGIYTYYPAVDIVADATNPLGVDLGLTYMESSKKEYMSMYVTGRMAGDTFGKVQKPVLVQAGQGTYYGSRAGDFSSVSFDPSTGTFWAANEYSRGGKSYWGTAIADFSVSAGGSLLAASSLSGGSGTSSGSTALTGQPIAPLDAALNVLYPFETHGFHKFYPRSRG